MAKKEDDEAARRKRDAMRGHIEDSDLDDGVKQVMLEMLENQFKWAPTMKKWEMGTWALRMLYYGIFGLGAVIALFANVKDNLGKLFGK